MSKNWSPAENTALIADYLSMLCAELRGEDYNKADSAAVVATIRRLDQRGTLS
jgi:hypothetical protein